MASPVVGLGKRLKHFRKAQGWNQWDMARHLGISQSNMSRLEADKQDLSGSLLRKIVELDEDWFGDLAGAAPKVPFGTVMVPMVGDLATDRWQPLPPNGPVAEDVIPVFGLEGRFHKPHAMTIADESMNTVFRPGTILIGVSPEEYRLAGFKIVPDLFIVTSQKRRDGTFARMVRQLDIQDDGTLWLWPRSKDPRFQQPIRVPAAKDWPDPVPDLAHMTPDILYPSSIVVMEQQLVVPGLAAK